MKNSFHKCDSIHQASGKKNSVPFLLNRHCHNKFDLVRKYNDIIVKNLSKESHIHASLQKFSTININQILQDINLHKDPSTFPKSYTDFLHTIFQIFNTIFFQNLLPPTKIHAIPSSSPPFPPYNLNVHTLSTTFALKYSAKIEIYGLANTQTNNWNHINNLLSAMLELYLQYFGCDCKLCEGNSDNDGKTGKGAAWQEIAHKVEKCLMAHRINKEVYGYDGVFDLKRRDLYVYELSFWGTGAEQKVADIDTLYAWGMGEGLKGDDHIQFVLCEEAREVRRIREEAGKTGKK